MLRNNYMRNDTSVLFDFGNLNIESNVKFKYVLLKKEEDKSIFVRGWTKAEFHADVAEKTKTREKLKFSVLGGGRIHFDGPGKKILVYGHSLGFPWPDSDCKRNEVTAEVIRKSFSGEWQVDWSNDGY